MRHAISAWRILSGIDMTDERLGGNLEARLTTVVHRYYLSGRCQEVIVIQIGDREGFQDMVHTLKDMDIPFKMETITEAIYNEACQVQVRNVASSANLTANAAQSDVVQKYVEYSLPTGNDQEKQNAHRGEEWDEAPRVITTDRESFKLLRVYRPPATTGC